MSPLPLIALPMLSYRHAFHAGNHADVLKHATLVALLRYFNEKDKPYWYIDTHAGAGGYALDHGYAAQNAEYQSGIGRLIDRPDLPAPLADYVAQVRQFNRSERLTHYPGSPSIARQLIRTGDGVRLFELHPTDARLLGKAFMAMGKRCQVHVDNGFAGLKAMLPPPTRRALMLIDPPYEDKRDYATVVTAIKESLARFATGTTMIWYPLLQRVECHRMPGELRRISGNWLHASLKVRAQSADGFGMHGSGLFIVNPPWTLPKTMATVLPALVSALGEDDSAAFTLEHEIA